MMGRLKRNQLISNFFSGFMRPCVAVFFAKACLESKFLEHPVEEADVLFEDHSYANYE